MNVNPQRATHLSSMDRTLCVKRKSSHARMGPSLELPPIDGCSEHALISLSSVDKLCILKEHLRSEREH